MNSAIWLRSFYHEEGCRVEVMRLTKIEFLSKRGNGGAVERNSGYKVPMHVIKLSVGIAV